MTRSQLLTGAILLGVATMGTQAVAAVPFMNAAAPSAGSAVLQVATSPYPMSYSPASVQVLLGQLGYNLGYPDGVIGPKSRAAIRAFQIDAGLPQSGEVSLALFNKLQEAVAKQAGGSPPASAAVSADAEASADLVGGIQGELRQRGYTVPSVSGQLDGATTAAIRAYQSAAGLSVTGQPSQALLTSLQSAPRSAAAVTLVQREQVKAMQRALNMQGYDAGPEDGAIGPKVRAAVRAFQTNKGMPVTGAVTPELLAQLGVIPSGSTSTASTTTTGSTTQSAGFGLTTGQVLQLEQWLTALGYKAGDVDGVYDKKTRNAIMAYQDDNRLTEDGLATPSLMASVQANLSARTGTTSAVVARSAEMSPAQILAMQQSLARQGYYFGSGSGVYDAETDTAVRGYQRDAGLPVTGTADATFLARLQSNAMQPAASPAVIRAIEEELGRKGYVVGAIDGQMDSQTQRAIVDFLRQAQLPISNAPSQQLLNAIRSSSMTASEGARRDLINTGADTLGTMLGNQ